MADSLTIFSVAGSGGISLTDTTNYGLVSVDWGDDGVDQLVFATNSRRSGGSLANQTFGLRRVAIRVYIAAAQASIGGLLRTLNRNLASPPVSSEIAYIPTGSSTTNYLTIVAGERAVRQDYDNPIGREYTFIVWTHPFWRTLALASPRILQNLCRNASFERWTAGVPDQWTLTGTPTTEESSTAWATVGLVSYHLVADAATEGRYQDMTVAPNTVYAVSVWSNRISGTIRMSIDDAAAGNVHTETNASGVAKLSYLYTTTGAQTTLRLFVGSSGGAAEGYFDQAYVALASNTADAIPTEWIGYTQDLYNHEDVTSAHVNGIYLADLLGDVPALSEAWFTATTLGAAADRIVLGLRAADPQYAYRSYQAEVGVQNGAWPAALANGGATASPEGVASNVVQLTAPVAPGTKTWTWACRVTLTPLSGEDDNSWKFRRGRYRAFARVASNATDPTSWELKAALTIGATTLAYSNPVSLVNLATYQMVDLGEITIPPGNINEGQDFGGATPLYLEISAQVTTETSSVLNIDYILLIPDDVLAQVILAAGAATFTQDMVAITSTLENEPRAWVLDTSANLRALAVARGDPFYLPVVYPNNHNTDYIGHAVLWWRIQRDDGQDVVTDRCSVQLRYIPQYLAPQ